MLVLSWQAAWLLWTVGGWIVAEAWIHTVRATSEDARGPVGAAWTRG